MKKILLALLFVVAILAGAFALYLHMKKIAPPADTATPREKAPEDIKEHEMPTPEETGSPSEPAGLLLEEMDAIHDHVEKYIGTVESVLHEIVSDNVHIDLYYVAPTAEKPYYTYVTCGMSAKPMTVPETLEAYRFAELIISLPADWPVSFDDLEDEANYWPIRALKPTARFPHENDTFLFHMHTIQNEDLKPYSPDGRFVGILVALPVLPPAEFHSIVIGGEMEVFFYALIPLYAEELRYRLEHGPDKLADLLDEIEVTELLDINRPNVCK